MVEAVAVAVAVLTLALLSVAEAVEGVQGRFREGVTEHLQDTQAAEETDELQDLEDAPLLQQRTAAVAAAGPDTLHNTTYTGILLLYHYSGHALEIHV